MNNCKKCNNKLNGIMIFHPDICLQCVITKDNEDYKPIDYLKHKRRLNNGNKT